MLQLAIQGQAPLLPVVDEEGREGVDPTERGTRSYYVTDRWKKEGSSGVSDYIIFPYNVWKIQI